MNYGVAGVVGAIATLVAVVSGAIATWRKSKAEADKSWQDMMVGQLEWQINRNNQLEERFANLERAVQTERADRRRTEAVLMQRVTKLEAKLRELGHDPDTII